MGKDEEKRVELVRWVSWTSPFSHRSWFLFLHFSRKLCWILFFCISLASSHSHSLSTAPCRPWSRTQTHSLSSPSLLIIPPSPTSSWLVIFPQPLPDLLCASVDCLSLRGCAPVQPVSPLHPSLSLSCLPPTPLIHLSCYLIHILWAFSPLLFVACRGN